MYLLALCVHDTTATVIYTLSLHDALPIYSPTHRRATEQRLPARRLHEEGRPGLVPPGDWRHRLHPPAPPRPEDRKSTRLNSSHVRISYAVFCLKKESI